MIQANSLFFLDSKKVLNQEQRKKLTNDELLYDPELDNQDELWMEKKLSRMLNILYKCLLFQTLLIIIVCSYRIFFKG